MLIPRIQQVLTRNGFSSIPDNPQDLLVQGGLDSLMLALLIIELEREFQVKIPVIPLVKERFESLHSIEQHLLELGAK
ncbi:MAG: acyl carrier protein [Legionella sp.]|nr:MAG: acyl carrier protein [Legionella sp.]